MKVKLAMLVGNEALQKLVDAPMPTATSFRVAKAVKEVQKELEVFEEQRQALIKKYGTEDSDKNLEGIHHLNINHYRKTILLLKSQDLLVIDINFLQRMSSIQSSLNDKN